MIEYESLTKMYRLSDEAARSYYLFEVADLLDRGLVEPVGGDSDPRHASYYRITAKGQALLRFVHEAVEMFLKDHEGDE